MKPQCSLQPLIPFYSLKRPVFTESSGALDVEIGFGTGEFLLRHALSHPERTVVGIEQLWERVYKTLKSVDREKKKGSVTEHIKILDVDAWAAFERLFTEKSIDRVYCLFPCPWPKKAHVKHRLFSGAFLKLLNSRLKARGQVTVVTDFKEYHDWIREELPSTGFRAESRIVEARYDTKFERKWAEGGQKEFFQLELKKGRHIHYPVKEDVTLKTFKVKSFKPEAFRFENTTGALSVVFKDFMYDPDKQRAVVRVLIAEEHLTQHIRVCVTCKGSYWLVHKADGQNFFPTQGVNKAIESVYAAAKKTVS